MRDSVTRYVVTHVERDGLRTLTFGAQGRWTYETPEEAQERVEAILRGNTPARLAGVFGQQAVGTFAVRPCACWPDHFDPKGIYFDE